MPSPHQFRQLQAPLQRSYSGLKRYIIRIKIKNDIALVKVAESVNARTKRRTVKGVCEFFLQCALGAARGNKNRHVGKRERIASDTGNDALGENAREGKAGRNRKDGGLRARSRRRH
jgi:hypothetical protein